MKLIVLALVMATVLAFAIPHNSYSTVVSDSVTKTITADWPAISHKINQTVAGNLSSIDEYSISVFANSSTLKDLLISQYGDNNAWLPIVTNGSLGNVSGPPVCPPGMSWNGTQCESPEIPPVLVEICGDGIDNDNDNLVDEGCPINPPDQEKQPDNPVTNVNESKWLRIASLGDIDNNNGLVTQANLAKKYNVDILIIPGDYCYDSCAGVISKLKAAGFAKDNTVIILGNHDSKSETNAFNGRTITYGTWNLEPKLGIFGIDANQAFGCDSTQFKALKSQLEGSDAWYNLAVVHQPFVTTKGSDGHSPNGQFDCWDPMFRGNGVNLVLQAHNHNYQRITVNGLPYLTLGTGTHDTGSSMYGVGSSWNGFSCKCITGTNGITIMDLKIDDPHQRLIWGWFLSNSEVVKDKFSR